MASLILFPNWLVRDPENQRHCSPILIGGFTEQPQEYGLLEVLSFFIPAVVTVHLWCNGTVHHGQQVTKKCGWTAPFYPKIDSRDRTKDFLS